MGEVIALPPADGPEPRELALFEVAAEGEARVQIIEIASVFRGRLRTVEAASVTIEAAGMPEEIDALRDILADYGLIRMSRSGPVRLA